jgi:hypothetical protein
MINDALTVPHVDHVDTRKTTGTAASAATADSNSARLDSGRQERSAIPRTAHGTASQTPPNTQQARTAIAQLTPTGQRTRRAAHPAATVT